MVAFLAVTVAAPLLLRTYVLEAFQIPSGGMAPTLLAGDHIFCSKRPWDLGRGDVIVLRYPRDPTVDYIKRIVGLPGDEVQVSAEELVVNGRPVLRRAVGKDCPPGMEDGGDCQEWEEVLDERAYRVVQQGYRPGTFGPVVVPEGHLFVLGDNRDNTHDSRVWGPLPLANVKAHALSIWWSTGPEGIRWNRIGRAVR